MAESHEGCCAQYRKPCAYHEGWADAIDSIAPPFKVGDRVYRKHDGVIEAVSINGERLLVRSDGNVGTCWEYASEFIRIDDEAEPDVVTRITSTGDGSTIHGKFLYAESIDEAEQSAIPLASTTRKECASSDAALCDGGSKEGAGGLQTPSPPIWTPTDGMLVERISDGACFRLEQSPLGWWTAVSDDGNQTFGTFMAQDLWRTFRPRYLQAGDVIEEADRD